MEDNTGCTVGDYFDNYDSDSTPIGLPVTLTDLLDDLSIAGSLSSFCDSGRNGNRITSKQPNPVAVADEVTETFNELLKNMSLGGAGNESLSTQTYESAFPKGNPLDAFNPYPQWATPIAHFQVNSKQSSSSKETCDAISEMFTTNLSGDASALILSPYNCDRSQSDCDKSIGQSTTYGPEWDLVAPGLSTSVSTLSGIPDLYNNHCYSLEESLRNMQLDFAKVDDVLASKLNETLLKSEAFDILRPKVDHSAESTQVEEPPQESFEHRLLRSVKLNGANEFRRTSICKYWQRGICQNSDCNFAHGKKELKGTVGVWKTTLCHHWKNGTCRIGADCRHAHGEEELQPKNIPLHILKNRLLNTIRREKPPQRKKKTSKANGMEESPDVPPEPKGAASPRPSRRRKRKGNGNNNNATEVQAEVQ
ncbi:uncharacterized protein BXIN_0602 [Babesia sp. Xinjiang]|uniref:uncharacterized protein n=1 Tax=Babesia sp. Xinjiang TaxID=462227 RepID=UPI000A22DEA4|nr:uncharacterized protein BXIN_0602 [Babesia sp. Xinjiang]ORM41787.1 hypothetical protein BXIN_0602 [Babesia sp. Xinjiang]